MYFGHDKGGRQLKVPGGRPKQRRPDMIRKSQEALEKAEKFLGTGIYVY